MEKLTLKQKVEFIICIAMVILALAFLIAAVDYMAKEVWEGYINWSV